MFTTMSFRQSSGLQNTQLYQKISIASYSKYIDSILRSEYFYLYITFFKQYYQSQIKEKITLPLIPPPKKKKGWGRVFKAILKEEDEEQGTSLILSKYLQAKAKETLHILKIDSSKHQKTYQTFVEAYIMKMRILRSKYEEATQPKDGYRKFLNLMKKKKSQKSAIFQDDSDEESKRANNEIIAFKIRQLKSSSLVNASKVHPPPKRNKYTNVKSRFMGFFSTANSIPHSPKSTINLKLKTKDAKSSYLSTQIIEKETPLKLTIILKKSQKQKNIKRGIIKGRNKQQLSTHCSSRTDTLHIRTTSYFSKHDLYY